MNKPKKHKIKAVANDTPGGKSAMSEMDPQKSDAMHIGRKSIMGPLSNHHIDINEGDD